MSQLEMQIQLWRMDAQFHRMPVMFSDNYAQAGVNAAAKKK